MVPCSGICSRKLLHLCWPFWRYGCHSHSCDGSHSGYHGQRTGMTPGELFLDAERWSPRTCQGPKINCHLITDWCNYWLNYIKWFGILLLIATEKSLPPLPPIFKSSLCGAYSFTLFLALFWGISQPSCSIRTKAILLIGIVYSPEYH